MIENMMSQVQNSGMIPGMNNPVVRPTLPFMAMGPNAPIITADDRAAVQKYDQEEAARNERRRQEREQENQARQAAPGPQMNQQANPFAAFMQGMQQPQGMQNFGAQPPQQQ